MIYRKATVEDCEGVYQLICQLEEKQFPFEEFSRIYRLQRAENRYVCLVCQNEQQIAGVLNMRLEEQLHHMDPVAEVMELAVDPVLRGNGIGKQLFSMASRLAQEADCELIELRTNQRRENAYRFYVREGMICSHFAFTKYFK